MPLGTEDRAVFVVDHLDPGFGVSVQGEPRRKLGPGLGFRQGEARVGEDPGVRAAGARVDESGLAGTERGSPRPGTSGASTITRPSPTSYRTNRSEWGDSPGRKSPAGTRHGSSTQYRPGRCT